MGASGVDEVGLRIDTGQVVIRIDPRYFRPSEVENLLGDPSRARSKLGWTQPLLRPACLRWLKLIERSTKRSHAEAAGASRWFSRMSLIQATDLFAVFGAKGMAGLLSGPTCNGFSINYSLPMPNLI